LPTTSTAESPQPLPEPVRRATYLLNDAAVAALPRLQAVAQELGVELVEPGDAADLAIVLGGDGTILRAFHVLLGRNIPVLGVNFGKFGFLTSIQPDELEHGVRRALSGDYRVIELPTLDFATDAEHGVAVNDIFVASAELGRMVELEWAVGGESLGEVPCDAVILATPSGSTAYNLSNGGPVLMWGLDASVVSFVAPHSLNARPLVVPRGLDVVVTNRTRTVPLALIADGQWVGEIPPGGSVTAKLGPQWSLLATLPDVTFLTRFRSAFG
jgi:NAD+ kinase